ncbi:unnamed protein product [Adineta ricciae]|uniref:Uncharacterized protein n=2 Tax=Adineta ricciae TaxID=249248 RepID=A0A815RB08_ADIRI|nr:unnamed protein product [Adineta ricciae]
MTSVESDICIHHDDTTRRIVKNDDRIDQNSRVSTSLSSSSLSSSPTSTCQCCLTNDQMLCTNSDSLDKSSTPPTSTHFSYLVRPTAPCIFGREDYYDEDEHMNDDDEFFLTAGGIVHSCPNIYELSIVNHRKLQSCDHLIFLNHENTLVNHSCLNCYDTELDRYSIVPRFRPIASSISTDSINSELELYKERHAIGLYHQQYHDGTFLPTTWKSDNYLLFMPVISSSHRSSFLSSIDHGKRSRSHDTSFEQPYASIVT